MHAAALADAAHPTLEKLRLGHNLLSREQLAFALRTGDIEMLVVENDCSALVAWSDCKEGRTLSILTVDASTDTAAPALQMLECAARASGARAVMSVGHAGWTRVMRNEGYTVQKCVFMKKVFND